MTEENNNNKIVISDKAMEKQTGIPVVVKKPQSDEEWTYAIRYLKMVVEKFKDKFGVDSVEQQSPGTWIYVNDLLLKHERYAKMMTARYEALEKNETGRKLTDQYVLIEHSSEVADITANAKALYPIVSLSSFKNANQRVGTVNENGIGQSMADEWLTSEDLTICKGKHYNPSKDVVYTESSITYFNTYRAPEHAISNNSVEVFMEHMKFLIPCKEQRGIFHDWLAYKMQNPGKRSFAVIMVADLKQGEDGHRYGTGRSTIGDIIGALFQSGVVKLDVGEITGTGNGQASYNEWADATQLCICEETSDDIQKWGDKNASYEALKKIIDIRPIPNVRIKPKYGKIFTTTVYTNFLFFTNHSDALQLPKDDRRFYVLDNSTGRRTREEYKAVQAFLNDNNDIAALYNWYMRRNIDKFDHVYPEMTVAKMRMIGETESITDVYWQRMVALLPCAIVSKKLLLDAAEDLFAEELDIIEMQTLIKSIKARWRKLAEIGIGVRLRRKDKTKYPALRIIQEVKAVQEMHAENNFDGLRTVTVENLSEFKKNWRKSVYEFVGEEEKKISNIHPIMTMPQL